MYSVKRFLKDEAGEGRFGQAPMYYTSADNVADGVRLRGYYRQLEKYGKGGVRDLNDGRFRFYGLFKDAATEGEMAGAHFVREGNAYTGYKRNWYETLDHAGRVRQVRPDPLIMNGLKVHYMFDALGNYIGKWVRPS